MAGGRTNPDATLDTTWDYNIATDSWTQLTSMPTPRTSPAASFAQGHLWSIGGGEPFCSPFTTTDVVSFDPGANTWTGQPALNAQRSFTGASLVGNTIVAAGGRDGAHDLARQRGDADADRTATSATATTASASAASASAATTSTTSASATSTTSATSATSASTATSAGALHDYDSDGPVDHSGHDRYRECL